MFTLLAQDAFTGPGANHLDPVRSSTLRSTPWSRVQTALSQGVFRSRLVAPIVRHAAAPLMIANEIGHFAKRHSGARNRSTTHTTAGNLVSEAKKEESEARRFAAMFLAPNYLLSATDTVEEIADRFGLSLEAAMIRKGEFDAFQRRASGKRRELPPIVVNYLKDAQKRGVRLRTDLD
jgi:hypothetical protein